MARSRRTLRVDYSRVFAVVFGFAAGLIWSPRSICYRDVVSLKGFHATARIGVRRSMPRNLMPRNLMPRNSMKTGEIAQPTGWNQNSLGSRWQLCVSGLGLGRAIRSVCVVKAVTYFYLGFFDDNDFFKDHCR
jgi:hypothetical protein